MAETAKLNQMSKLVVSFLNRADTGAFHAPVDPRVMGIPDYFEVVKNPMDLGTVSETVLFFRISELANFLLSQTRLAVSRAVVRAWMRTFV